MRSLKVLAALLLLLGGAAVPASAQTSLAKKYVGDTEISGGPHFRDASISGISVSGTNWTGMFHFGGVEPAHEVRGEISGGKLTFVMTRERGFAGARDWRFTFEIKDGGRTLEGRAETVDHGRMGYLRTTLKKAD